MKIPRHDVFWGTHGCFRMKGHANPCLCICNTVLTKPYVPYGDDADSAVFLPLVNDEAK